MANLDILEFGELYARYQPRFVVIAQRYVRSADIAEDLVADSFASFWEEREKLPNDVNIPAYILTMVKNRCLNHLSAVQRHNRIEHQIYTTHSRIVEHSVNSLKLCNPDELFADEVVHILERELQRMPELRRVVFQESRFGNKTYAEISQEQGISVRRVTSEIQLALATLRFELKDYLTAATIVILLGDL